MTDYRSMYDKDYIGAWDLQDKDVTVTITKCISGQLVGNGGRKAKKPIVYMRGTEKGFALNATNGKTIAAMYGNNVEAWAGKRITLYKSTTRNPNGDGEVECIRVRPQIPSSRQASSETVGEQQAASAPPTGAFDPYDMAKSALRDGDFMTAADLARQIDDPVLRKEIEDQLPKPQPQQ